MMLPRAQTRDVSVSFVSGVTDVAVNRSWVPLCSVECVAKIVDYFDHAVMEAVEILYPRQIWE